MTARPDAIGRDKPMEFLITQLQRGPVRAVPVFGDVDLAWTEEHGPVLVKGDEALRLNSLQRAMTFGEFRESVRKREEDLAE